MAHAAPLPPIAPPPVEATTTTPVVKKLCNCYQYVKKRYPNLPQSIKLTNNFKPRAGRIALFNYNGVPHYAIQGEVVEGKGFFIESENNYKECETTYGRFVSFEDPAYIGTWWSDEFEDWYGGG